MIDAVYQLVLQQRCGTMDEAMVHSFCTIAVDEVSARLRAGVVLDEENPTLLIAIAWIALDLMEKEELTDFSVGDFSVKKNLKKSLREKAEKMLKPYVLLSDFAFQSVEG